MCHDADSRPPGPPDPTSVAASGPIRLTSDDGATFPAFAAEPTAPNGASVVLLPDVRGVHLFYRDLTVRFAEAGFAAVAIDYYGRTAPSDERDGDFDWESHLPRVQPQEVTADVRAAASHLRARHRGAVFTVGFCFGGGQSWRLAAASELGLAGAIGFYGLPQPARDVAADIGAPVLMLLAGADVATPQAEFDELAAQVTAAGAEVEMAVYPGAPHSFFDRSHTDWTEACDDAWRRILAFTTRHAAGNDS